MIACLICLSGFLQFGSIRYDLRLSRHGATAGHSLPKSLTGACGFLPCHSCAIVQALDSADFDLTVPVAVWNHPRTHHRWEDCQGYS
jgi:hypothetical protein